MLESLRRQTVLPTEVLYVGLPSSGSAVVQYAAKRPLANNLEQRLIWCTNVLEHDERAINWCILETVARAATTEQLVIVANDVVLHRTFAETIVAVALEHTIVTSFPAILSPELSSRLDEAAIAEGKPFTAIGMLAIHRMMGKAHGLHRLLPLGWLGVVLDRLAVRQYLSTSAVGLSCRSLERLLAVRQWCDGESVRKLLSCAGIVYYRATHQARHVQLTESRPQIFALAPVVAPEWRPSSLGLLEVRPVLRRHRLN